jgi:ABC-type phosphate/phosphonate transport system substrate-binding protein
MRDTDCDLTSVIVVRGDSKITDLDGLAGAVIGAGAVDSPQATLLPLDVLRQAGLLGAPGVTVRRYDVGVGLHGDHIGGERDAARALVAGDIDAACMIDANHLLFSQDGTLPSAATRVIAQTKPYDHCNMTVRRDAPPAAVARFRELLLTMDYADPSVRPLLDLEGLKAWRRGRTSGYDLLEHAVDATGFYDAKGTITADDYRP